MHEDNRTDREAIHYGFAVAVTAANAFVFVLGLVSAFRSAVREQNWGAMLPACLGSAVGLTLFLLMVLKISLRASGKDRR